MKNGGKTTEFREIKSEDGKICQIKNGKENRDRFYRLGNVGESYTIRYSSSRETNMACPDKDIKENSDIKIVKVLERERKRFEYDTGKGYTYMFTRIKDGTKSKDSKAGKDGKDVKDGKEDEKYEFEIEYDIKQLSPELIQESLWLIMQYFQTNLPINTVDGLLKEHFSKFDKNPRLMPPKPVNIKLESYQKLKANPYTVTNKLDGERFLLFFLDECVYARQGEKVVYITNCDKKWDYTLIDVEFF